MTHLNKGQQGNLISRVSGSIAFIASARASYLVTRDNDDHDLRLMLTLKNNLAKDNHGFGYRIEEKNLSGIETSCVTWEKDAVNLSAEDVLIHQGVRSENRGKAEEFLMNELVDGLEIPSNELYRRAEDMGISPKVLWSIKDKLGVQVRKKGYQGPWLW